MVSRDELREGMTVYDRNGDKLGKIIALGEGSFHIEKGLIFPKDYLARLEDIQERRGDELYLARAKDELLAGAESWGEQPASTRELRGEEARLGGRETRAEGALRVPLAEEQLDVTKRDRQVGEVKVHKEVITEMKNVEVPLRRETVHVERTAAPEGRQEAAPGTAFQDETLSIPVRAEEVEIHKRPVVREEIRVTKGSVEEERRVAEPIRHEEARVRTEGDVESAEGRGIREESEPGATRIGMPAEDNTSRRR